jgi:hypothetical protein
MSLVAAGMKKSMTSPSTRSSFDSTVRLAEAITSAGVGAPMISPPASLTCVCGGGSRQQF